MNVLIRKAGVKDIKAIQDIAYVTWHHTYSGLIPESIQDKFLEQAYSEEFMAKRLDQSLLLVAEKDEKVIGFANAFQKAETAELSAIYIYPDYQGEGIGTQLLGRLLDHLKPVVRLNVEVEKGNISGEKFYEKNDFQLLEEYEDDLFGHPLQTKKLVLNV